MRTYYAEQFYTYVDGVSGPVLAVNNTTTGKVLHIESVKTKSNADFTVHGVFLRYPSLATGGDTASLTAGDNETVPSRIWRRDSRDAAPSFEIRYDDGITPVVWPTAREYAEPVVIGAEPRDDGASVMKSGPLVVGPGESFVFHIRSAYGAELVFGLEIREVDVSVEHIASANLPAAGAFTEATYFDVPDEWSELTFLVTYTAAVGTTTARPKVRVALTDDTTTVFEQAFDTTLDIGASPVARRDIYTLEDVYPAAVSAGSTVSFPVTVKVRRGMPKARLDVAEHGQTSNPGTCSVKIVGG